MNLLGRFFKTKKQHKTRKVEKSSQFYNPNTLSQLQEVLKFFNKSTHEQAAAVHETMASIEEMRSMIAQTNQHVARSLDLAREATALCAKRLDTVNKMQTSMKSIKESNQLLKDFQSSLSATKNKTRVINDIVVKTQLLSFNASIEAARSGQYGKGFAVVADEVGRLAQTTGRTAKEIETLLSESQERADSVVTEVVTQAEGGIQVATEVVNAFLDMTNIIDQISNDLNSMNEASQEHLQGMEQATIAIEKINSFSVENHKNTEKLMQIVSGSKIENQEKLQELMEHFSQPQAKKPSADHIRNISADDPSFTSES